MLSLRSVAQVPTGGNGSASVVLSAVPHRGRRIRVRAELQTDAVRDGASLWAGAFGASGALLVLNNAEGQRQRGTTDWTPHELWIDVPAAADRLVVGTLLLGTGEVRARRLVVTAEAAPDANAPAAAAARIYLDSAIALARRYALTRDTVSWDVVVPELHRRLAGARRVEDAYPVVDVLARRLGDLHSRFVPPASARGSEAVRSSRATSGPVPSGAATQPAHTSSVHAEGRVGYVRVPAHAVTDSSASRDFAVQLRTTLSAQQTGGACSWIVDLRGNTGGATWPMLAGLRPLLGEGEVGGFADARGTLIGRWGARAPWDTSDFYARGTPRWPDLKDAPVAVLTDGLTASAGEMVAVAFRGRPHTRSFGTPTMGLSTGNVQLPLPGGGLLALTTAVYSDRTGQRYGQRLAPDVPLPASAPESAVIDAAQAWLREQQGCAAGR